MAGTSTSEAAGSEAVGRPVFPKSLGSRLVRDIAGFPRFKHLALVPLLWSLLPKQEELIGIHLSPCDSTSEGYKS